MILTPQQKQALVMLASAYATVSLAWETSEDRDGEYDDEFGHILYNRGWIPTSKVSLDDAYREIAEAAEKGEINL